MWTNKSTCLPFRPTRDSYRAWSALEVIAYRSRKYQSDKPRGLSTAEPDLNDREGDLVNFHASQDPADVTDLSVMPLLRALQTGDICAYIQIIDGFLPVPKTAWDPELNGGWPVGRLLGPFTSEVFGSEHGRELPMGEPYEGSTIMFMDYEAKAWIETGRGKVPPATRSVHASKSQVEQYVRSMRLSGMTKRQIHEAVNAHFRPLKVTPNHVNLAIVGIEGKPRPPGRPSK